jgi:hypothetical protein
MLCSCVTLGFLTVHIASYLPNGAVALCWVEEGDGEYRELLGENTENFPRIKNHDRFQRCSDIFSVRRKIGSK